MNTKLAQTEPEQIKKEEPVRMSGILVHPTSFPSPYGIGDLGPGAYDFIDFLAGSGQTLWQVLPLGPTGFGDSPYQGFSAFAGQPLIISTDLLIKANLLTKQDIDEEGPQNFDPRKVDYGPAIEFKTKLLKKAWRSFTHTPDKTMLEEFELFCQEESYWLDDYTLFMACKDYHEGRCWLDWEKDILKSDRQDEKGVREKLEKEIGYYRFIQFIFTRSSGSHCATMLMKKASRSSVISRSSSRTRQHRCLGKQEAVPARYEGLPDQRSRSAARLFQRYRTAVGQPAL